MRNVNVHPYFLFLIIFNTMSSLRYQVLFLQCWTMAKNGINYSLLVLAPLCAAAHLLLLLKQTRLFGFVIYLMHIMWCHVCIMWCTWSGELSLSVLSSFVLITVHSVRERVRNRWIPRLLSPIFEPRGLSPLYGARGRCCSSYDAHRTATGYDLLCENALF